MANRMKEKGMIEERAVENACGERWRPVVGYEGAYEVSDMGRVRSLDRPVRGVGGSVRWLRGRVLKPNIVLGYHVYHLSVRGEVRPRRAHRLVLEAFVGTCPDGHECCHSDGDPKNNALSNLRWGTKVDNAQDTLRHGTNSRASRTHCPRGHPHSLWNVIPSQAKRGKRSCLACGRARAYVSRTPGMADSFQEVSDDYYRAIMEDVSVGK